MIINHKVDFYRSNEQLSEHKKKVKRKISSWGRKKLLNVLRKVMPTKAGALELEKLLVKLDIREKKIVYSRTKYYKQTTTKI